MPFYVLVQSKHILPTDPFAPFKTEADKEILKRFKKGERLVNWNYTCPVNWYLETRSRQNQTMLSGKDLSREDSPYSVGIVQALLDIGTSAGTSDGVIAHSWAHRDGGMPGKEWFHYDEKKVQERQALHQQFRAIKAQWDAVDVPFAFEPGTLSNKALAFLRTMKRLKYHWQVPPIPEFQGALKELRMQGLLNLQDNGLLQLKESAYGLRVPRGPELVTLHRPTRAQLKKLAEQDAPQV